MAPIDPFEKRKRIKFECAFKKRIHEYLTQSLGRGQRIFKDGLVSS